MGKSGDGAGDVAKPIRPELFFCLSAASGTDTHTVTEALSTELRSVGYTPVPIRLSSLMATLPGLEYLADIEPDDERIRESIKAGNRIRRLVGSADAVVRLAIAQVQKTRAEANDDRDVTVPAEGVCYIISSLKRKEEIDTLRLIYGKQVFLVSIYEPKEGRIDNLSRRIARSRRAADEGAYKSVAEKIIDTDQKERGDTFGQRLEDVFPLADVFLKAGDTVRNDVRRFIQLLFGAPFITPTADEFLMFHARSTANRSADLSRQVGAVIATSRGEILSTGCNEVPRAGGGVQWDDVAGTNKDYRDYKLGVDAAAVAKIEIVSGALKELKEAGWLKDEYGSKKPEDLALLALFEDKKPLAGTMISSLLEFGRIVHAEMAAISDAAMRGIAIKDSALFCTTFPCHMCARHIIAAGVKRVVYIEPYPKSRAKKLYKRAVQVDEDRDADDDAVKFEAFVGVAPTRFFDLFDFIERKDSHGYAHPEAAPSRGPKGVAVASFSSELESVYFGSMSRADWSETALENKTGEAK
jgi:deoxycytidylate deaminase